MSLLNTLTQAAGAMLQQGAQGQSGGNALLQVALSLLQGQGGAGGGLPALIQQFQQAGLGEQMQSWIGTGANLPVSPEQIQAALGGERVGALASQMGLDPQMLSGQLANVLPGLIDQLTPQGQLPEGDLQGGLESLLPGGADQALSLLQGMLGKR